MADMSKVGDVHINPHTDLPLKLFDVAGVADNPSLS